jgi:DNA-directed RNA polymerase alpha subunit
MSRSKQEILREFKECCLKLAEIAAELSHLPGLEGEIRPILRERVESLMIDQATINALKNVGIERVGQLIQCSRLGIIKTPNIGLTRLAHLEYALTRHDLELESESDASEFPVPGFMSGQKGRVIRGYKERLAHLEEVSSWIG